MTHVDFLGQDRIYCKPMSDAVSNAMRMLSVEPLTEGVPCHCATDGIFPNTLTAMRMQSRALSLRIFLVVQGNVEVRIGVSRIVWFRFRITFAICRVRGNQSTRIMRAQCNNV
jgi:hypothetical protein